MKKSVEGKLYSTEFSWIDSVEHLQLAVKYMQFSSGYASIYLFLVVTEHKNSE